MNNLTKFIENLVNNARNQLSRNIVTELLELSLSLIRKKDIWSRITILQGFILIYFGKSFSKYINSGNIDIFIKDFKEIAKFFLRNPLYIITDIIKFPAKICAKLLLFLRIPLAVIASLAVNNSNFLSRKSINFFVESLFNNNKSQFSKNFANSMIDFLVEISPIFPFLTVILIDKILGVIINYLDSSKLSNNPDSLSTYKKIKEINPIINQPRCLPDQHIPEFIASNGRTKMENQLGQILYSKESII